MAPQLTKRKRLNPVSTTVSKRQKKGVTVVDNHTPFAASSAAQAIRFHPEPLPQARDPTYYFVDGDIILRSVTTLFRVHTEKFHNFGTFFDILSTKKLSPDEELVDGVPVCPLPDTKPDDVRILVAYVYNNCLLTGDLRRARPVLNWDAAVTLLHFSDMYDIYNLRTAVIDALRLLLPFPPLLDQELPHILGVTRSNAPLFLRSFPLQAILLCHRYNLHAIRPMAYYHAAQLSLADIVGGVVDKDGTRQCIDQDDVIRVLEGREKLKEIRRTTRFKYLVDFTHDGRRTADQPRDCETLDRTDAKDNCFTYILRMALNFARSGFLDARTDLLEHLPQVSDTYFKSHLCEPCQTKLKDELDSGMRAAWKEIPRCFEYKSWIEVIEKQIAADELAATHDFS